ncbi:unnamed protein product [Gulo gulo]|uniref:Uncharacterized protein n=1 Tax=Gulo gulo TaxID=48420 RepID=A0A9X9LWC0_GULGU|nr:unnamed protein product [Gulo gulo]
MMASVEDTGKNWASHAIFSEYFAGRCSGPHCCTLISGDPGCLPTPPNQSHDGSSAHVTWPFFFFLLKTKCTNVLLTVFCLVTLVKSLLGPVPRGVQTQPLRGISRSPSKWKASLNSSPPGAERNPTYPVGTRGRDQGVTGEPLPWEAAQSLRLY